MLSLRFPNSDKQKLQMDIAGPYPDIQDSVSSGKCHLLKQTKNYDLSAYPLQDKKEVDDGSDNWKTS